MNEPVFATYGDVYFFNITIERFNSTTYPALLNSTDRGLVGANTFIAESVHVNVSGAPLTDIALFSAENA